MKIQTIAIIIISGFLLSGCSLSKTIKNKDGLNLTKQQIFENNEACQKRRNDVDEILSKDDELSGLKTELIEIFYSPTENTCVYFSTKKLTQEKPFGKAYSVDNINDGKNHFIVISNFETDIIDKLSVDLCNGISDKGILCAFNLAEKLKNGESLVSK